MKQERRPNKNFCLNKKAIATLSKATMGSLAGGGEASPEFTSIFACHTKRCSIVTSCQCTMEGCPSIIY